MSWNLARIPPHRQRHKSWTFKIWISICAALDITKLQDKIRLPPFPPPSPPILTSAPISFTTPPARRSKETRLFYVYLFMNQTWLVFYALETYIFSNCRIVFFSFKRAKNPNNFYSPEARLHIVLSGVFTSKKSVARNIPSRKLLLRQRVREIYLFCHIFAYSCVYLAHIFFIKLQLF